MKSLNISLVKLYKLHAKLSEQNVKIGEKELEVTAQHFLIFENLIYVEGRIKSNLILARFLSFWILHVRVLVLIIFNMCCL